MENFDRVRSALSYIPADDRDLWVRIGMAIKSEFGEAGFPIFDEWSTGSDKYEVEAVQSTWKSFDVCGGITGGTLFHEAKKFGWQGNDSTTNKKTSPQLKVEMEARQRKTKNSEKAREAQRLARVQKAAQAAAALIEAARPATPDNPYLSRKGVKPVPALREMDVKQVKEILGFLPEVKGQLLKGMLLVAPVTVNGELSTVELIDGAGLKYALPGGRKGGGFVPLADPPAGDGQGVVIMLGEGISTTLSAMEATGYPGVAALSCGNLPKVAEQIRKRYPAAKIIVLADLGNGESKAVEAAQAMSGYLARPDFGPNRPDGMTDFNDLHQAQGMEAVRRCIESAERFIVHEARPIFDDFDLDSGDSETQRLRSALAIIPAEAGKENHTAAAIIGMGLRHVNSAVPEAIGAALCLKWDALTGGGAFEVFQAADPLYDDGAPITKKSVYLLARQHGWSGEIQYPAPKLYTADDFREEADRSTIIPDSLIVGTGIIEDGIRACEDLSGCKIIQFNFPLAIVHIATAIAGKICCNGVHPSFFFIKIAGTSTGKTDSDMALKQAVAPLFNIILGEGKDQRISNSFYGPTDFASGPGLLRSAESKGRCLIMVDEMSFMFGNSKTKAMDPNIQGKIKAILELSTSAGQRREIPYSDTGKTIIIDGHCLSLIGNTTPLIYKAFTLDDLQSGLIQRFDFWAYDGKAPYRELPANTGKVKRFVERLKEIRSTVKPPGSFDMVRNNAIDVGLTVDAAVMLNQFSRDVTDERNAHEDEGLAGIVSRKFNSALKFALVHSAGTRAPEDLFAPIDVSNLKYGIEIATLLTEWKVKQLVQYVTSGEFDDLCNQFVAAIKSAIRNGKKPTGKLIVCRRPALKNIKPREWDDIVRVLRARGVIYVDESGRSTVYNLIKEERE